MSAITTHIPVLDGLISDQDPEPGEFKPIAQPGATIEPWPRPTDLRPNDPRYGKGPESGSDSAWRENTGKFDVIIGDESKSHSGLDSMAHIESYDSDKATATTKIVQTKHQPKSTSSGSLIGRISVNILFGWSTVMAFTLTI